MSKCVVPEGQQRPSDADDISLPSPSICARKDRRDFIKGLASFLGRTQATLLVTAAAFGCGGGQRTGGSTSGALFPEETGLEGYVRLAFNESPYGPAPEAVAAIDEMLSRPYGIEAADTHFLPGINRYPDFLNTQLTETLARFLGLRAVQIIPCCGVSELLYMCSQAFLGTSRTLLMTEGTFPLLRHYAVQKGAEITFVPPAQGLLANLDAMLEAVDSRTGIVYLANPDNPTGTMHALSAVEGFVDAVSRKNPNAVIVIDEAYVDYATEDEPPLGATPLVWHYPVVVGRTFSKAYGLAGLRAGYAVCREDISGVLNGFLSGYLGGDPGWRMFEGNVNRIAAAAVIGSLSPGGQAFLRDVRGLNSRMRRFLVGELLAMGYEPLESCTNFLLVRTGTDGRLLRDWLCSKKILVQAGASFHPRYADAIRVSIGDQWELERMLEALRDFHPGAQSPVRCTDAFFMGI